MEMKSTKKENHVLHKVLPRETRQCQSSLQWRYGEGYERCVSCTLPFIPGEGVVKLEVLEVREEADEIQDLSTGAGWLSEGEESKRWREVPKALLDGWHETWYLEVVYSKFLEVCKCGKVTQRGSDEPIRSEPGMITTLQADPEPFDERKQAKLV